MLRVSFAGSPKGSPILIPIDRRVLLAACVLAAGLVAAALVYSAVPREDFVPAYRSGALEIGRPWARATPPGATIGGGYLEIRNTGGDADRLTGGTVAVADRIDLHAMSVVNNVMTMLPMDGGIEIKPGETVKLDPNGSHIMFVGLKQALQEGDHVAATLTFAKAGTVSVDFTVGTVGAMGP